jgi:hypothetical protein
MSPGRVAGCCIAVALQSWTYGTSLRRSSAQHVADRDRQRRRRKEERELPETPARLQWRERENAADRELPEAE